MSKMCEVCGKGYLKGNQVPRGIGRRVTRRTSMRQMPNIRSKKFNIDGVNYTVKLCASCLKRMSFTSAAEKAAIAAQATK